MRGLELRRGKEEGKVTCHAQAQAYTIQERARQCEPKQEDDGRHGGQGSVRSRMITKLEATLKRGPRVSGRARKAMMEEAAVEERY